MAECAPETCEKPDPDACFRCKLRYWRENGGLRTHIPAGWGDQSVYAAANRQVEEAKSAGFDPVPTADRYRWV